MDNLIVKSNSPYNIYEVLHTLDNNKNLMAGFPRKLKYMQLYTLSIFNNNEGAKTNQTVKNLSKK